MNQKFLFYALFLLLFGALATTAYSQVPRPGEEDEVEKPTDTRKEMVVIGIQYDRRVNFKKKFLDDFKKAFWDQVDASPVFKSVKKSNFFQKIKDKGLIIIPNLNLEDSVRLAKEVSIPYVLWIEVNPIGKSKFQILLTLVRTSDGKTVVIDKSVSKSVKGVEKTIKKQTKAILAAEITD